MANNSTGCLFKRRGSSSPGNTICQEAVARTVLLCKRMFYEGHHLVIRHLPRTVTEKEVSELVCDLSVSSVRIDNSTTSKTALVDVVDIKVIENWNKDRVFLLRGQPVQVRLTASHKLLCVARLPLNYTLVQFAALVKQYGEINKHFLMVSENTGKSKGYGFVEYKTYESALHAKQMFDKTQIEDCALICDWLDSNRLTYQSLHSKCLYVDQLPKACCDLGNFRKLFSAIVEPTYCHIALKNGCPQDWGLVEFSNADDAEVIQTALNGYKICGQPIRISYHIPGISAINVNLQFLKNPNLVSKKRSLLPDPSNHVVAESFQKLYSQNPVFAQQLENIILTEIHVHHPAETRKRDEAPKNLWNETERASDVVQGEPAAKRFRNDGHFDSGLTTQSESGFSPSAKSNMLKDVVKRVRPPLLSNPSVDSKSSDKVNHNRRSCRISKENLHSPSPSSTPSGVQPKNTTIPAHLPHTLPPLSINIEPDPIRPPQGFPLANALHLNSSYNPMNSSHLITGYQPGAGPPSVPLNYPVPSSPIQPIQYFQTMPYHWPFQPFLSPAPTVFPTMPWTTPTFLPSPVQPFYSPHEYSGGFAPNSQLNASLPHFMMNSEPYLR